MSVALFLNGMYEDVLSAILTAQEKTSGAAHYYLQPYSPKKIKFLAKEPPTALSPRTLYLSLTNSLADISYRANIVGWRDKAALVPAERKTMNEEIKQFQPNEKEIYLEVGGKPCVNLIFIADLQKLPVPIPVSCFIKISDNKPLKAKSRAGGWAYVQEQPDLSAAFRIPTLDHFAEELQHRVNESFKDTAMQRQARLAHAPIKPKEMQVLSRVFVRNSDVIVEVLVRANGKCEGCGANAPFIRASDGTPYLEIHHKAPLASGGDDTVANAIALCPNCHRRKHYGKVDWPAAKVAA